MKSLYQNPILFSFARIIIYALIVLLVSQIILWDSLNPGALGKFGEDSSTEWAQEIFLLLTSLLFARLAYTSAGIRGFPFLMSGVAFMGLIREYNNYLHTWFYGAWQLLVLPVLMTTIFYIYRNRRTLYEPIKQFIQQPAFGFTISGFLAVMVFSRFFGTKSLWKNILEVTDLSNQNRWVKNAAEEGSELLGYSLLFIGAL
ncbi:MAG: hypothetical protein O3A40_09535, partial [Bacteroidetes bacterium]|nr:hypothetical protein [Bacteroidota bacterium]